MTKNCDVCDEAFKDGEAITFVADGRFKVIASDVHYAMEDKFRVTGMYHPECFIYGA